jgi:hypothetical protein
LTMSRYVDRTEIFREQVRELARVSPPDLKRVKGKGRQSDGVGDAKLLSDGFLEEAYAIVSTMPLSLSWCATFSNVRKLTVSLRI